jgi:hypothetical protein
MSSLSNHLSPGQLTTSTDRASTLVEVARSVAMVGGFAVTGTAISSTVIDLATGAAGTGALLVSVVPMLVAMLAYTTGHRRLSAAGVVLVVAVEVATIVLYGASGAVVAVLPLVIAAAVAVVLVREAIHPYGEGLWWLALMLLALSAGVSSAAVWVAGRHSDLVFADRAYPLLLATAGLLVAAVIYALSLGRGLRRRVHLITLAALCAGAFPAAVWGLLQAGDAPVPQPGRGPTGFAILALVVAFRFALCAGRSAAASEPTPTRPRSS